MTILNKAYIEEREGYMRGVGNVHTPIYTPFLLWLSLFSAV
jgi:hypothetical protein